MILNNEDFNTKTAEILKNINDPAIVSTILAEIVEHNNDLSAETTKAKEIAEKITADNETLRQANMNLFLKVGEQKPLEQQQHQQQQQEIPQFTDLFDEKGNLK